MSYFYKCFENYFKMKLFALFLTALLPFTFSQDISPPTVTISVDPKNSTNEFSVTCQLKNVKLEALPEHSLITYFFIPYENDQLGKIELASWSYPAVSGKAQLVVDCIFIYFLLITDVPALEFVQKIVDLSTVGIKELSAGNNVYPDFEAKFKLVENDDKSKGNYYCQLDVNDGTTSKYYFSHLWSTRHSFPDPKAFLTSNPSKVNKFDTPFTATCWVGNFATDDIVSDIAIRYYSDDKLIGMYDLSFTGNELTSAFAESSDKPSDLNIMETSAIFPRFEVIIQYENTETNSSSFVCSVAVDGEEEIKSNVYIHEVELEEITPSGGSYHMVPSIFSFIFVLIFQKFAA